MPENVGTSKLNIKDLDPSTDKHEIVIGKLPPIPPDVRSSKDEKDSQEVASVQLDPELV